MSPASSGNLEVEKYIGACLITQQRPKNRDGFYSRLPEVYPGSFVNYQRGMPLISFAHHQNHQKAKEDRNPLARLAVHTQGAPLILTKSFRRNNKKKNFEKKKESVVDTVSVTSDESSGSTNSDNCLPRIIKPRKRRKKDRKPSRINDGFSTDSASPDIELPILRNYSPFIFDPHVYGLVPDLPLKNEEIENETPQLHHTFEDVEESTEVDINGNQTLCQCRYCDPSGQIWDVDRNCYSPFLTSSKTFFQFPMDNNLSSKYTNDDCLSHGMSSMALDDKKKSPSGDLEVSTEIVTSLNGHRDIEIKFFSSTTSSADRILNAKCDSVNNQCKFVSEECG